MQHESRRAIYLDNHATTRCDPRVVEAIQPFFSDNYGNPSSIVHAMGRAAEMAVEGARGQIAELIGAHLREIIFTSGATESNNLAILGLAHGSQGSRRKIITSAVEHKSVLNTCKHLEREGFEIIVLPVDARGRVEMGVVADEIDGNTLLVSIQAANNEIGTIQSIRDLSLLAHDKGAYMHCDAAQAVGKIPVDVLEWGVDLISVSAHKMYGPKGIGALYLRGGPYALPLEPILVGGGQEYGLRSGTLNVPAIVGMGVAAELARRELPEESQRIAELRDQFEANVMEDIEVKRNGDLENRLPGNSNLTFVGMDAEALIASMPFLMLSTGSACTSGAPEPSHVLQAIGLSRKEAYSTIRVCFGRFNADEDVNEAATTIKDAIAQAKTVAR
jgi:cysteine desulfurase